MTAIMTAIAELETVTTAQDPIIGALGERTPLRTSRQGLREAKRANRRVVRDSADIERRYRGGLDAEKQALKALRAEQQKRHAAIRSKARGSWLSRQGRPINIAGLLGQLDPNSRPVWTIADPRNNLSSANGHVRVEGGDYRYDNNYRQTQIHVTWPTVNDSWARLATQVDRPWHGPAVAFQPDGIPALPKRVRELIRDPKIQRRANRIGVLYMPDTWQQEKPDPALVVEWKDLPGQFFALAVWGGDRHRIMEWVS